MNIWTWEEYKKKIGGLVGANWKVLYRGQSNDTWRLTTSFHHEARAKGIALQTYIDTMLPEIHYQICGTRGEVIDLENKLEFAAFLALLQHHGFPTPLLDWTMSPYIAAYFAFRDVSEPHPMTDYVKIYVFDYLEWLKTFSQPADLRDMSIRYVSIIRPFSKFTPRMIPQQGMFTVTNVEDMQSYIEEQGKAFEKKFLFEVGISSKEKPHVIRELASMGINEMTLFPGIDGICRALKRNFFSADKIELTFSELMQRAITPATQSNAADGESEIVKDDRQQDLNLTK